MFLTACRLADAHPSTGCHEHRKADLFGDLLPDGRISHMGTMYSSARAFTVGAHARQMASSGKPLTGCSNRVFYQSPTGGQPQLLRDVYLSWLAAEGSPVRMR